MSHDAVTTAELSAVSDAADRLQGASTFEGVRSVADDVLLELVPSDSVSFNWVAPGQLHATIYPEQPQELLDHYGPILAERWRENPLAEHFRRTADTRPLTWGDVTDDVAYRRSSMFRDFYEPLGVLDQLGMRLPSRPGAVGGLVLNRGQPTFSRRDRALLGLMGGHVAHRLHALGEAAAVQRGLRGAGWDVVSVTDDAIMIGGGGETAAALGCRAGRPLPEALSALLVAEPLSPGAHAVPPTEPRGVAGPRGQVTAFVVPGWPGPHSLFLREDHARELPGHDRTSLGEHGLSPRQSDVALLLLDGQTNQMIASQLRISLGTVKKHCQQLYAVLDVDNRAAAAATLARLVG